MRIGTWRAGAHWLSGLAAVGAGAVWLASWLLNTLTRDNTVLVLGRTEGQYRSLLNPALVLLLVAGLTILILQRRSGSNPGAIGAGLVALGLFAMLIGNLVEFGLDGTLSRDRDAGFAIFLAGYLVLIPFGGLLLARGRIRAVRPPWQAGASLLVAAPIVLVLPIVAHVLFATAWALLGVGMVRRVTLGDGD